MPIDVREYKRMVGCLECSEYNNNPDLLVYHHINPLTKLYNISDMRGFSDELILNEIAKCIVLCQIHHIMYHSNDRFTSQIDNLPIEYEIEN